MNLKNNKIIKALEVLKSWQNLAYHNDDGTDDDSHELYDALTAVFDYINRLETENKALNRDNDRLLEEIQDVKESEIKTAKKYHAKLIDAYKKLKTARTEAVKEFAERLKEKKMQSTMDRRICTFEMIDNILKEMVGESDEQA